MLLTLLYDLHYITYLYAVVETQHKRKFYYNDYQLFFLEPYCMNFEFFSSDDYYLQKC